MAVVRGDIFIDRPPEAVFDVLADERNEPRYNSQMVSAELLTGEPVGPGSRFRATMRTPGRPLVMLVEVTALERPRYVGTRTTMPGADIAGGLFLSPEGGGTRMRWCWHVEARGPLRLLGPLAAWIGRREERAIWGNLKRLLEKGAAEPSH